MNLLLRIYSKDMEGKRKRQELPDGSGWGDHVQLLQIFESWDQAGYDPRWCSDHDLQVNGDKNWDSIMLIRKFGVVGT